jgi:predicted nucleic-acid-binding protein
MKKYFIDTNYFLRLLLKDNLSQFKKVYQLFQLGMEGKIKIYTSVMVVFEIYWVLSSFYKRNKKNIVSVLKKILAMRFIDFENIEILEKALDLYSRTNLDFEDCYNIFYFKNRNCRTTAPVYCMLS